MGRPYLFLLHRSGPLQAARLKAGDLKSMLWHEDDILCHG